MKKLTTLILLLLPMAAQADIYLCTETADYISDIDKTQDFYFPETFVWVVNTEQGIKQSFEEPDAYRGSCEMNAQHVICTLVDHIWGGNQRLEMRIFDMHFSWVSQSPDIVRTHLGQCAKT
jgi:hypothetical protein